MENGERNRSIVEYFRHFFRRRAFASKHISRINSELRHNVSIEDVLVSHVTLRLFYKYLEYLTGNDSKIMRVLRCYDLCDEFLCDIPPLMEYEINNIFEMCSKKWQRRIDLEFGRGTLPPTNRILTLMTDIRNESLLELEVSDEYSSFKREILEKSRKIRGLLKQLYREY